MVRAFHKILRLAGSKLSRQRRHQFTPSIAGAASCLEDRALLNGGGGSAHAAVANLANTPAGRHVTRMYENVLGSAPTQQQVTQLVHQIRSGTSFAALHRQLVVEARTQAAQAAAVQSGASASSGSSASSGNQTMNSSVGRIVVGSRSANGTGTITPARPLPPGLVNSSLTPVARSISVGRTTTRLNSSVGSTIANTRIGQLRAGTIPSLSLGRARTLTFSLSPVTTTGSPVSQQTGTPTLINTSATGTTGTTATGSPLASLLTNGAVPTPVGVITNPVVPTIGTQGALTFAPLTFGPVAFTPTTFVTGSVNPSPVPTNGTLPFTGSPVNPSPVPTNGTLPFTGTTFNPSPVPTNGTLPFTGMPTNPSPVPPTGVLF